MRVLEHDLSDIGYSTMVYCYENCNDPWGIITRVIFWSPERLSAYEKMTNFVVHSSVYDKKKHGITIFRVHKTELFFEI
jgi:hypothetical protein